MSEILSPLLLKNICRSISSEKDHTFEIDPDDILALCSALSTPLGPSDAQFIQKFHSKETAGKAKEKMLIVLDQA